MEYEEIKMQFIDGKLIPAMEWLVNNLDNDPDVESGYDRDKVAMTKFMRGIVEQFHEFFADDDNRDDIDEADVFGDDEIVVGPDATQTALEDYFSGDEDNLEPDNDDFESWDDNEFESED